ncbi:hypothetical protein CQ10_05580 [Bradyrhizobium valentinum]|uniref:Uncharacterized protein n=2 Tax=Bradyrhizobium valentinum TaxID=1518501 RepID=A0A0R3K0X6_9BRAD|nr:hypothetical protein CP49_14250 [Bradyrhizobium valentinum]KRQ97294.1 hypothetical protein CQ10_05580 [Bradyrhizobium valentinum]
MKRPRPGVVEPLLPGRGRDQVVALSRVNAVFTNDVRELSQKLPKPGVLLDQRVSFVGLFVATKGGLVPAKGILKQRKSVVGRFLNPK